MLYKDNTLSITEWLKWWLNVQYVCDAKDFKYDIWHNLDIG